jgi:hypothetical protein
MEVTGKDPNVAFWTAIGDAQRRAETYAAASNGQELTNHLFFSYGRI